VVSTFRHSLRQSGGAAGWPALWCRQQSRPTFALEGIDLSRIKAVLSQAVSQGPNLSWLLLCGQVVMA
jgi:hypothetical protein